jgi:hypothetical protein
VQWQGFNIANINGAVINSAGQIGDNLNVTSAASAAVTVTAIRYNQQACELDEPVVLNMTVNPYFTGTVEDLNASGAQINVTDTSLVISSMKENGGSAFSLPVGATVYRLFQPETGLTPEASGLTPVMSLASANEIMDGQTCKINKRWNCGRHTIYIADQGTIYRLTLLVDHLGHDASKPVSYVKAGNDVLVANAVRLNWAEGQAEIPVHTVTCGQVLSLPVQVWATEPMAVRLVATWTGGSASHEVDLVQGSNDGVVFPITFQQAGNFDLSIYAELR